MADDKAPKPAKAKTVKLRGLGVKHLSLPHSDLGSDNERVDRVTFDENGIAEVSPEVAEVVLDIYKQSVIPA